MKLTGYEEHKLVVEALAAAGVRVQSVFDLVNTRQSYPAAIPVLMDCLDRVDNLAIKEGLVRSLTCKEARGVAGTKMLRLFQSIPPNASAEDQLLKWAVGNCLKVVATEDLFDDLVDLVRDTRHGKAREMVVVALGEMRRRRDEAIAALMELLQDDQVVGHAVVALAKLRAKEAEAKIQDLIGHPKEWIRREAEKALNRIRSAR